MSEQMRPAALFLLLVATACSASEPLRPQALVRNDPRLLWPNAVVPYMVDDDVPNKARITDAISHWQENTPVRFVERTDQRNYIRFSRQPGICSSPVGMVGGEQRVSLQDSCSKAAIIHELGHAIGLLHEHSRQDRDLYVRVLAQDADRRSIGNFVQVLVGADDFGYYDYASIMHYSGSAGSRAGLLPIRSIPEGIPVGRTEVLSPADIDAVKRLYGFPIDGYTVTTFPPGLEIEVDGERFTAPRTFSWQAGTRHTISAVPVQVTGRTRHVFARWNDDRPLTHTITVSPDVTTVYTANFIRQYLVSLTATPGGRITLDTPSDQGWFTDNTEVQVRAIPNEGREFIDWSGFGQFGLHGESPNPLRFVITNPNVAYAANFGAGPVTTITSRHPGMRVLLDGTPASTPIRVAWPRGSTHTIEVAEETQFNPAGTARHTFTGWSNEGARKQTITVEGDATYTAHFRTEYQLVIQEPTSGNRIVPTPSATDNWYEEGAAVTLRAEPGAGFRHLGWAFDATGTDNPVTIIMDDQKLVAGAFAMPRQIAAIVNGANFVYQGGVAPGTIIAIRGLEIGPAVPTTTRVNAAGQVATDLDGYRLMFDDIAAPLLYATRDQIGAVVPFAVAGRTDVVVRLVTPTGTITAGRVPVLKANPAFFTANASGRGNAAALNQDGSLNSPQNPAAKGSVVVLYGTGEGAMTPGVVDGRLTTGPVLPRPVLPVRARVGGVPAALHYAGAAPGLVAGATQWNIQIPEDTPSGPALVAVQVGEVWSVNNVVISVQ